MQCAVIAAARRGGLEKAGSEEFGAEEGANVIYIMDGQKGKESTGGTMRLGDYPAKLKQGSKTAKVYGAQEVTERHRHRYEVNNAYRDTLTRAGLVISGVSPDERLVEMIEIPDHPWFIASQGHPEFKSRPTKPHPLFMGFVEAACAARSQ